MPKTKVELKVSQTSHLIRFAIWYMETKSTTSATGRVMKGRSNEFFIRVLEGLSSNSDSKQLKDDLAVFKEYAAQKDKSAEEILAEKTFKDDPEKMKTWKELQKQMQAARFKK